ncbi:MAG: V-type ATP synthase subunit E [Ruminococcus sp.]|nr:V-type ATP synthase subunit E [Ruminococcus sp.]
MSSGEKIINRINSDCDEAVNKINANIKEKREAIIAEAEKTAEKEKAGIEKKTNAKLSQMSVSAQSRSQLEIRNTLLKKRREEIDKTVDGILSYLLGLPDGEYFEFIYKLAAKIPDCDGEILLNAKDLMRKPADFENRLKDAGLNVSVCTQPVDIQGGFVLKKGNIEENLDFSALISSNRDSLEDYINRELFKQ